MLNKKDDDRGVLYRTIKNESYITIGDDVLITFKRKNNKEFIVMIYAPKNIKIGREPNGEKTPKG